MFLSLSLSSLPPPCLSHACVYLFFAFFLSSVFCLLVFVLPPSFILISFLILSELSLSSLVHLSSSISIFLSSISLPLSLSLSVSRPPLFLSLSFSRDDSIIFTRLFSIYFRFVLPLHSHFHTSSPCSLFMISSPLFILSLFSLISTSLSHLPPSSFPNLPFPRPKQ